MVNSLKIVIVFTFVAVFSSCSKEKNSNFQSRLLLDAKPQVKDVLKGKSKPEVLKMKYKNLAAGCSLEIQKITRGQLFEESAGYSPTPPGGENPVSYPNEHSMVYDIKLQQLVDRELAKDVTAKLSIAKDGQVLNVDMTFKPVAFQEVLNVDMNKKKYILKHSPVLDFVADYQLLHSENSTIVGKLPGKIFEKIEAPKNEIIAIEIGQDKYSFMLHCKLNRTINSDNAQLATEFENQWIEVDCTAPKNEEEKAVCQ